MKLNTVSIDYKGSTVRILDFYSNGSGSGNVVRHSHKTWELHFASSGSYEYVFDNKIVKLSAYQMLIIPPNTPHNNVLWPNNDYKFSALCLDLVKDFENNEMNIFFKETLTANALKPINITPSILKHCELLKQNSFYDTVQGICKLQSVGATFIYEVFASLGGFKAPHTKSRVSNPDDIPLLLAELINGQNMTLKDMAEVIGYSTRHTARLIKEYGLEFKRTKNNK